MSTRCPVLTYIYFLPHTPNQLFSFYDDLLLPPLYSYPVFHQHGGLFRHCIPRRSREPVCMGSAPSRTSDSADRRPAISVRPGGGGGWFYYLGPLMHHQLNLPAIYVYTYGGGVVVLIPGPLRAPPTFLSMSVLVGI